MVCVCVLIIKKQSQSHFELQFLSPFVKVLQFRLAFLGLLHVVHHDDLHLLRLFLSLTQPTVLVRLREMARELNTNIFLQFCQSAGVDLMLINPTEYLTNII